MIKKIVWASLLWVSALPLLAQPDRWQQRAEYNMDIDFDVNTNRFQGEQKLVYYNNSPDTLTKVFYHLYLNAFQPGSMMDTRSRTIQDPDPRVRDRIAQLNEDEIGFQRILSLKQDGKAVAYQVNETILEVSLQKPILPGKKASFEMSFEAQVPLQIRRTGRDNAEGVRYTMTQWYPKMAEYDYEGWHANPYIGREFHGTWGDYDVKISIDSSYVIGGSGYLQNPQQIGHGYEDASKAVKRPKGEKLTWHFKAPQVHDFAWAADPDFVHETMQVPEGPLLHFFYQPGPKTTANWTQLQPLAVRTFQIMNQGFGKYPYQQYSIIQGGDGGMEYAMATMITGERSMRSLIGVTVHEAIHSWFQHVLATNESLYPWMDEGFTTYAQDYVTNILFDENQENPQLGNYAGYVNLAKSGKQEPLTTHADHFISNRVYGQSSYTKGAVLLSQLNYIMGEELFMQGMRRYYDTWKFKHPNPTDFKRVMEKASGLELDWLFLQWIGTTNTIDYRVAGVSGNGSQTEITLERMEEIPMPIDLVVTYKDGSQELFYIPLQIMRGEKSEDLGMKRTLKADWPWVYPEYKLTLNRPISEVQQVEIDPSMRMADMERQNNVWPSMTNTTFNAESTTQQ
jgi:hypothetical protein